MSQSVPETMTALMAERIEAVADLFPGWVNRLVIEYSRSMEDVITADVQYEYRCVCLTVHPAFFGRLTGSIRSFTRSDTRW